MSRKFKRKCEPVPFYNKALEKKLVLPSSLTIAELTVMGIQIHIVPKEAPIKDGELRHLTDEDLKEQP